MESQQPSTAASVGEGIQSVKTTINDTMNDFSSKSVMNASNEFLAANTILAKFLFILLVLIVFMAVLNLGLAFVYYFTSPSTTPYLIYGLLPGSQTTVVSQNPSNGQSLVAYRSNNQSSGVEFTWSVWLQMNTMPTGRVANTGTVTTGNYNNVFVKGTNVFNGANGFGTPNGGNNPAGVSSVNNGPGLYVISTMDGSNVSCLLHFVMDVISPLQNNQYRPFVMDVSNVPINKWVHTAFRLQNKVLDCYINGVLTNRMSFKDYIPKQNYDDVIVCGNAGFPGSLSNLRYYDYALSIFELNSVVYYGPNLNAYNNGAGNSSSYLSHNWYSNQGVAPNSTGISQPSS